jgi:hypothetical protein
MIAGPPRRVLVRLHDWDDDRPQCTVRYLVLTEGIGEWTIAEHTTRYRAITRGELSHAAKAVGFDEISWPNELVIVGNQQVMTALNVSPS